VGHGSDRPMAAHPAFAGVLRALARAVASTTNQLTLDLVGAPTLPRGKTGISKFDALKKWAGQLMLSRPKYAAARLRQRRVDALCSPG